MVAGRRITTFRLKLICMVLVNSQRTILAILLFHDYFLAI